ncbi:ABC transporter permease [Vitreimonas flagellata]|uniref:ABC transporter permease n=1 Tax=Vitreimonas flagellata TaxID=2560861 RepID=UPI0010754E59|nr:ABC transporter permease [Vitreimonas flagellata]
MLAAAWRYRHFIWASIVRDVRARFAGSKLGLVWSILHPLAQAAIYTLILAEVLGARVPGIDDRTAYPVYLMAGLAAWGLFSEILTRSVSIFLDYSNALKKIAFPRISLPLIVCGGAIFNHVLLLLAVGGLFVLLGHPLTIAWAIIPVGIILISAFAIGLGLILGTLNVFERDVAQLVGVVLQLWFWLTPIAYFLESVPAQFLPLMQANPMTPLVQLYQGAMLYGRFPTNAEFAIASAIATLVLIVALFVFRRASADLVDAL